MRLGLSLSLSLSTLTFGRLLVFLCMFLLLSFFGCNGCCCLLFFPVHFCLRLVEPSLARPAMVGIVPPPNLLAAALNLLTRSRRPLSCQSPLPPDRPVHQGSGSKRREHVGEEEGGDPHRLTASYTLYELLAGAGVPVDCSPLRSLLRTHQTEPVAFGCCFDGGVDLGGGR